MELLDYLIGQRVYFLLNEMTARLSPYLRDAVYEVVDVEQCVEARKLLCKIRLQNDAVLAIR